MYYMLIIIRIIVMYIYICVSNTLQDIKHKPLKDTLFFEIINHKL